jgi:Family of unknown function (DUF6204)
VNAAAEHSSTRRFRVTVRGRFFELTDEARRYLVSVQAEHDLFKSSYTEEGTLTYDNRVDFFNFRYELDAAGDAPAQAASDHALGETEAFLKTMGFGYRNLKPTVVDLTAIWDDVRRREA